MAQKNKPRLKTQPEDCEVKAIASLTDLHNVAKPFFRNLNLAIDDLKKEGRESSFYKLMMFLTNSSDTFPYVFSLRPTLTLSELETLTDFSPTEWNAHLAIGFSEWIIQFLISILTCKELGVVHKECQLAINRIFHLIRQSDPTAFARFVHSLFAIVNDLRNYSTEEAAHSLYLTQFTLPPKLRELLEKKPACLNLEPCTIEVYDVYDADELRKLLLEIIERILPDLYSVRSMLPFCLPNLWEDVLDNLRIGCIPLKMVSFNLIVALFTSCGLPDSHIHLNPLCGLLGGLVDACFSCSLGGMSGNRCPMPALERSLALVLQVFQNKLSEAAPTTNVFALYGLAETMLKTISLQGLMGTTSKTLRLVTLETIPAILKTIENLKAPVPVTFIFLHECMQPLIDSLESSPDCKSLVPLLTYIIQYELRIIKRHSGQGDANNVVKEHSGTFQKISSILDKFVQQDHLSEPNINGLIICCNVLLEATVQSLPENKNGQPIIPGLGPTVAPAIRQSILDKMMEHVLSIGMDPALASSYKQLVRLLDLLLWYPEILPLNQKHFEIAAVALSIPTLSSMIQPGNLKDLPLKWEQPHHWRIQSFPPQQLHGLSLIPPSITFYWTQDLFLQNLTSSNSSIAKVLQDLPFFLHVCPQVSIEEFKQPLLNLMQSSVGAEILIPLCRALSQICCVCSQTTVLVRNPKTLALELRCNVCSAPESESRGCSKVNFMEEVLEFLMQCQDRTVGLASVPLVQRYFSHFAHTHRSLTACLKLASHPDFEVRLMFSNSALCLIPSQAEPDRENVLNEVVHQITQIYQEAAQATSAQQETFLYLFLTLANSREHRFVILALVCLIKTHLSTSPYLLTLAKKKISLLAENQKLKLPDLYRRYKIPICQSLAKILLTLQDMERGVKFLTLLSETFGMPSFKFFLKVTSGHILPDLALSSTPFSSTLIRALASHLEVPVRELIIDNFQYIFPFLVIHCTSSPQLKKCLAFMEEESGVGMSALLRCSFQNIHNELLKQLSDHYEAVFSALAMLAENFKDYQGPRPITTPEQMAEFLNPRMLGYITFFDTVLVSATTTLEDKKQILNSLGRLIDMMGSRYITATRMKLMATLRIALRYTTKDFPQITCQVWDTFVHNIEESALRTILLHVVVALIPHLEYCPTGVAKIFNYLILDKREVLSDSLGELYFIPEIPELEEVNGVLRHYTLKVKQSGFHVALNHYKKGLNHENLEVRLQALVKIKDHLAVHQKTLHEHLQSRELVDPLISQLIMAIMPLCKDTDPRWSLALAECLGNLGAIDPGRLEIQITAQKEQEFHLNIEEDNFAFNLLMKLIQTFLAADCSNIQDCCAFALQELLQVYDWHREASPGNSLWSRIPTEYQEIIRPFLTSKYKINQESQQPQIVSPIYGSKLGKTYEDWINTWVVDLFSRVEQAKPKKVFYACSMVCKYDLKSALYLLPYLVLYALQDTSDVGREEIHLEMVTVVSRTKQAENRQCHMSAQAVFDILDYIMLWTHRMQNNESSREMRVNFEKVQQFVEKMPLDLLSSSAFDCHAYARALLYLELHLKRSKDTLDSKLDFLQKIYVDLDDTDSAAAVALHWEEPQLSQQIQTHLVMGQMQEAYSCYERATVLEPNNMEFHCGLLRSQLALDNPNSAHIYANGLLNSWPQWRPQIREFQVEASWKLSDWVQLEQYLQEPEIQRSSSWPISIGKLMLAAYRGDLESLTDNLKKLRINQMIPLAAAASEEGAYMRGYPFLLRLHILTDIENIFHRLLYQPSGEDISSLLVDWKGRWQLVESSLRHQTPILNLQRSLLRLAQVRNPNLSSELESEIAHCWLHSAKLARMTGRYQEAYKYLLDVDKFNSPKVFIEKARLFWYKGMKEQALLALKNGIGEFSQGAIQEMLGRQAYSEVCAKAKLLLAQYSDEAAIQLANGMSSLYMDTIKAFPEWEEGYFHLATYLDRTNLNFTQMNKSGNMVEVVKHYSMSLRYGCKHIYHSLARILTLWFDLASSVVENHTSFSSSQYSEMKASLGHISQVVCSLLDNVPLYYLLTALPQLISRICHSHKDVFPILKEMLAQILITYPQQAIWMMIAVSKSSYATRVQRCLMIFARAKDLWLEFGKVLADTTQLTDLLIALCNKKDDPRIQGNLRSLKDMMPQLIRLVDDRNFGPILLPLQSVMAVSLPSFRPALNHNPFPQTVVYIHSFLDMVEILTSLQRPKKITIRGSDGNIYNMLCKPKDDLRKDFRFVEFTNLVNRYLKQDPDARKRQLHIRTFAVTPLNEECGLIEWVPNLTTLRTLVIGIYKEMNIFTSVRELRNFLPKINHPLDVKLNLFKTKLIPRHPPVLDKWFLRNFTDPTAWYMARQAYIRSTAVISVVGYILGLGDRHGENILFDSTSGDTVHVDFNCLFNKGETFEWPERVPFRLTHNMVDAMGPLGYNGAFRKACEVTMAVVRGQKDVLISVLRPFIHDPLLEWTKAPRSNKTKQESGEIKNSRAVQLLQAIEDRLHGRVSPKSPRHQVLSIEGHVDFLIQEATSETNLCQMYAGWAPFI